MIFETIGTEHIDRIARDVFGEDTKVRCVQEIAPSNSHGVTETPPSTRNLLYLVELEGHPHGYVFRFSRVQDDVYEKEARNYRLLTEHTDIRVPTIYLLDTSKRVVPTSYMVMDYLQGKLWQYQAHPNNPRTDQQDKDEIAYLIGGFYARVHDIRKEMNDWGTEAWTVSYSIDRLENAARQGHIDLSPREIDDCRRAVFDDPVLHQRELALCLADSEIHVIRKNRAWELAFICDAEWVEYRHPFSDLAQSVGGTLPWWKLDRPAPELDPDQVAALPFFRGYTSHQPVDFPELLRLSGVYQLGLWAYVAETSRSPEKKMWIKSREPLIRRLVQLGCQSVAQDRNLAATG